MELYHRVQWEIQTLNDFIWNSKRIFLLAKKNKFDFRFKFLNEKPHITFEFGDKKKKKKKKKKKWREKLQIETLLHRVCTVY